MTETTAVLLFWVGVPAVFYLFLTARLMRLHWQDLNNPDTPIYKNLNKKVHTDQKGGQ